MYTFCFAILWTVLAAVGVFYFRQDPEFAQQTFLFKVIITAMPFAGIPFIWNSLRKLYRFRSVRRVDVSGHTEYIWTDVDGSEKRSASDPRPAWDKEDRDFTD